MHSRLLYCLVLLLFSFAAFAQKEEQPSEPFFHATRFHSAGFVQIDGVVSGSVNKAAFITGFNLNWLVNHKYYLGLKYQVLGTQISISKEINLPDSISIPIHHMSATITGGYILFWDKKFSFNPELSAGWGNESFTTNDGVNYKRNLGVIIPSVNGIYNATKFFRIGVGMGYRGVIGGNLNGFNASKLGGVFGDVFIRIGTF